MFVIGHDSSKIIKMAEKINWKEVIAEQIRVFNKQAEEIKKEQIAEKKKYKQ